jgi:hypothetical protein
MVSGDAGQFNVGRHALCWVHAERIVHKGEMFTDPQRSAQRDACGLIWRRSVFAPRSSASALHANKAALLMVLDRPEIPLHTSAIQ